MRLVGPNCFGVAVPGDRAGRHLRLPASRTWIAGLVAQSGGLGFALADRLSRLGIGVSSFASVGNKYDVSSNDMLMWWEQDDTTKLAILYIESFGNPRKFARTARRVGRTMPILTVHAGRSDSGQPGRRFAYREPRRRPWSAGKPFRASRHYRDQRLGELLDVAALLASQPVRLAATSRWCPTSAAPGAGRGRLRAVRPDGPPADAETRRRLHALVPPGGSVTGPVDTTATWPKIRSAAAWK